jgi:hypothetical protein
MASSVCSLTYFAAHAPPSTARPEAAAYAADAPMATPQGLYKTQETVTSRQQQQQQQQVVHWLCNTKQSTPCSSTNPKVHMSPLT